MLYVRSLCLSNRIILYANDDTAEPESSDSDDQFTDAHSGPTTPHINSPIPKTRVEKIDTTPSHGEVPGTEAHKKREADAQPDEIAVTDESNSGTPTAETFKQDTPITVLEPVSSNEADSGCKSTGPSGVDAEPDIVLEPADDNEDEGDDMGDAEDEEKGDDFGDDFDDFEEGGHDEDFDDFEEGFQQPPPTAAAVQSPPPVQPSVLPFVRTLRPHLCFAAF